MRSFSFETVSEDAFDAFGATHPQGNFQQTSAAGRLRRMSGIDTAYLAVVENSRIAAAALVETRRSRMSTFCMINDGPLCDWDDAELTAFLMDGLASYARSQGADHLTMTPERPYLLRDSHGAPMDGGAPDDALVESLTGMRFAHEGFTRGYTAVPRWRYVKDLAGIADEKALLASYDKRTQWSVKRAASMGVHVDELGADELDVFAEIERQTAQRRGFAYRGADYFRDFKAAYGDRAHFMVARIHIGEYVADIEAKRAGLADLVESLQAKHDAHPTTKTQRRLAEERRNLEAAESRLAAAAEYAGDGDVLPAAASLFVEHPREVVYLFSGSVERYKPFYASALLQHRAMADLCLARGVERYNFYGISGVFDDPDDEGRGVLEFKQGFDGYVEELPGEFTLPVRPLVYGAKRMVHRALGLRGLVSGARSTA